MILSPRLIPLTIFGATATLASAAPVVGDIDFNEHIRPILNKNCTSCHGGVKQAGGVSFIYRDQALGEGKSGEPTIVPGNPGASAMVRRITTDDLDERMPPADEHPRGLAAAEIDLVTQWIQEGAAWGEHWSFNPPADAPLPKVSDPGWPRQALDHLVLARLDSEKLHPSPAASPAQWLRRATFDLTGLPPTLEELREFEAALPVSESAAFEAAVERLLASPAYGEHLAAMWLDLARYSDTFGFEKDPHRDIWPFRDWVIQAFNADLPFDAFTIKQLAGDLLPNPDPGDLIASAFHRNTQNNTEGGTDDEEYRMAAVVDRVNTTWTAWNGTTFGCVQCHSHPYDPIPHDAYYEFLAFFNNSEDIDQNDDFPRTKVADDPARQADAVRLEQQIRTIRQQINTAARTVARDIGDWSVFTAATATAQPDTGHVQQQDHGDFISSGTNPNRAVFTLTAPATSFATARVSILPLSDDPTEWDEQGAVLSQFEATLVGADGTRRAVPLREVVADFLAGPFDPNDSLRNGSGGFGEYPMMKGPRTAWIVPHDPVVPQPGDQLEITIRHGAVCNGSNQNCVLRRFRIELSNNPALTTFTAAQERAAAWRELQLLEKQYKDLPGRTIPVMRERADDARRETRLFIRGNRSTLDKVVAPRVPAVFSRPHSETPDPQPPDRLDMARWIVGPDNPLAARVLANRLWAGLFGPGLVETLEDFGSSGARPSHPQLLDHLALRLRDHHQWHLKPFLRELVLSSTYRQDHRSTPALLAKDPHNRLLARGPRQRLSAEMVRDQALLASGLLSRKTGGPPVYPPQPDGVWRSVYSGEKWNTSEGEDRYRRAIYTYRKRTSGYPAFLTFDAPTGDVCAARRIPTNTPLQALVTLNDPAHLEFAQALAQRMAGQGPDLAARLGHGWRLVTLSDPDPGILDTLTRLHTDTLAELTRNPGDSAKLDPDPVQAALVMVANTILNSDAALNR